MTENAKTPMIEGLLEEFTPLAFNAAKNFMQDADQHNDPNGDTQAAIDILRRQHLVLIHAVAELEFTVRRLTGDYKPRD